MIEEGVLRKVRTAKIVHEDYPREKLFEAMYLLCYDGESRMKFRSKVLLMVPKMVPTKIRVDPDLLLRRTNVEWKLSICVS